MSDIKAVTNEDIIEALEKTMGNIRHAAKLLGYDYNTGPIFKRLKRHPEMREALEEIRRNRATVECDFAEDTVSYAMQQRERDLATSLKAAIFTLNNLGKDRGYCHPDDVRKEEDKGLVDLIKAGKLTVVEGKAPEHGSPAQ